LKKKQATKDEKSRKRSEIPENSMLVEWYENIRGFFAGYLNAYTAGFGIAVLMNKGLSAWIQSIKQVNEYQPSTQNVRQTEYTQAASSELVILLANMVERKQAWMGQQ